jgi:hypothetical protein
MMKHHRGTGSYPHHHDETSYPYDRASYPYDETSYPYDETSYPYDETSYPYDGTSFSPYFPLFFKGSQYDTRS